MKRHRPQNCGTFAINPLRSAEVPFVVYPFRMIPPVPNASAANIPFSGESVHGKQKVSLPHSSPAPASHWQVGDWLALPSGILLIVCLSLSQYPLQSEPL